MVSVPPPSSRPAPLPPPSTTPPPTDDPGVAFDIRALSLWYGRFQALRNITLQIPARQVTALIGPSGCGKSTLLRCLNRMNELVPDVRIQGEVYFEGANIYAPDADPVEVRRRIGMVFQRPNPFPKSIYDNVAFGPRTVGMKGDMDEIVERALRGAALWDDVKDRLKDNAYGMSGGQQQRLCIARAIATEPDVILMDEPCSALDPVSTGRIEDLMLQLKERFTIVVVTHNMQQAARVSDMTAFLMVQVGADEHSRWGELVEYDETNKIFTNPSDERTDNYISGRIG